MTHYLLAVHGADGATPPEPEVMQQMFDDVDAFNSRVRDAGGWVFAGGLEPPDATVVVRSADGLTGTTGTTHGPYAPAPVFLSGMWIVEAPDRETALDWAAQGSAACRQPVEVRAFEDGG